MPLSSHNAHKIRGIPVSSAAPTNTQVLAYNSSTKLWTPTAAGTPGAGSVDYTQLAADVAQVVTVNVTSAQIKTLFSAPITLVAAPGAGSMILPLSYVLEFIPGGTQYTAGGAVSINLGTNLLQNPAWGTNLVSASSVNAAIKVISWGPLAAADTGGDLASVEVNAALTLTCQSQNFATGNGTAVCRVVYQIVSGL